MLYNQLSAIALVATTLLGQSDAFGVSFSNYFDFSAGLGLSTRTNCNRKNFYQCGSSPNINFLLWKRELDNFEAATQHLDAREIEIYQKRELGEALEDELSLIDERSFEDVDSNLDKRTFLTLGYPKAAFTVSDVAWISDDLFKVSINFQTAGAAQLFSNFYSKCSGAYITGCGGPKDSYYIVKDGNLQAGFNNFFQWSTTIVVKAVRKGNYWCLPPTFGISFQFNKSASLSIFNYWQKYFLTSFTYGCQPYSSSALIRANFNVFVNAAVSFKRDEAELSTVEENFNGMTDLEKRFFNFLWLPKLYWGNGNKLPLYCWAANSCSN